MDIDLFLSNTQEFTLTVAEELKTDLKAITLVSIVEGSSRVEGSVDFADKNATAAGFDLFVEVLDSNSKLVQDFPILSYVLTIIPIE